MPIINKPQKDYIKDLAVVSAGGVTGMLVDSAVANAYGASGLPIVKLGTLGIDDILLLAAEGIGGYYLRKKGHKTASDFVIGMFAGTVILEVGEAIMSAVSPIARAAQVTAARINGVSQVTRYVIA